MRTFLIVLLLLPSMAFAAPHRHATPTPAPGPSPEEAGPSRQDLLKTVDHIVVLSQDLQKNLALEKAEHKATDGKLVNATKANSDLQRRIDKDTRDFNDLKDKYATQSRKLWWYRIHFFLGWVLFITGILAGAGIWLLKITGKLGVIAAKI